MRNFLALALTMVIAQGTLAQQAVPDLYGNPAQEEAAQLAQLQFPRTLIVSATGSARQNGQRLQDTIASIRNSSAARSYLVKILPGIYDVGNNQLLVPEYVDVEGSGSGVTRIKARVGLTNSNAQFVFALASNTEIRELAIEFTKTASGPAVDTGAITTDGQSVSVRSVRIKGPGNSHEGVRGRLDAAVRLRDVDVNDVLIAVRKTLGPGTIELEGLRTAAPVMAEDGGTVIGRNSVVGSIDTNRNGGLDGVLRFANTQILGNTAEPGTAKCVYSYDNDLNPLDASCN